jgi:hypothetical protein
MDYGLTRNPAGIIHISVQLRYQLGYAGKRACISQAFEKIDCQRLAEKFALKTDQVHLHFASLFPERRVRANVQSTRPGFAAPLDCNRIDAVSGHQRLDLLEVCSGKTDCPSPLSTGGHGTVQAVRPVEKVGRIANCSALQRFADAATGDWLAALQYRRDNCEGQAGLTTKRGERLDRAFTVSTKAEVDSFYEGSRGQALLQDLLEKLGGAELQKSRRCFEKDDAVRTTGMEEAGAPARRC